MREFGSKTPIASGALIRLNLDGKQSLVFLLPQGAGTTAKMDGEAVRVVTPVSNLGESLLGLREGDVAEVEVGNDVLEYEIVQVR